MAEKEFLLLLPVSIREIRMILAVAKNQSNHVLMVLIKALRVSVKSKNVDSFLPISALYMPGTLLGGSNVPKKSSSHWSNLDEIKYSLKY